MIERKWKTLNGQHIENFYSFLSENLAIGGKDIHIGSDSQQHGNYTEYVTVFVMLTPGKGGRVFYTQEKVKKIKSLRERLFKEVMMSTELAMELTNSSDIGAESLLGNNDITIHIDANPNNKHKSSEYIQELAGLTVGQGFKTLVKPSAWASSHVADHAIKSKVMNGR